MDAKSHRPHPAHVARWAALALLTILLTNCGGAASGPSAPLESGTSNTTAQRRVEATTVVEKEVALPAQPTAAAAAEDGSTALGRIEPKPQIEPGMVEPPPLAEGAPVPAAPGAGESRDDSGAAPAAPSLGDADVGIGGGGSEESLEGRSGGDTSSAPSSSTRPEAPPATGAEADIAPLATAVPPAPASSDRSRQFAPVTAGVIDDNAQWQAYLDYRIRQGGLDVRDRDVTERYVIQVSDSVGQPVHDATVQISANQQLYFEGRTDAGGRLLFHPRAINPQGQQQAGRFDLLATKGQATQRASFGRGQSEQWAVTLPGAPIAVRTQLDLLFLIDATGSMGDEIDKLKATMGDIADEIGTLPERPDVRYGLVAYRDRGDQYVVRTNDFTSALGQFQTSLSDLRADGGGDEPEALNEALHNALTTMSWRDQDTVRIILLVADAPPQLHYNEPFSYDTDMIAAVQKGIKIFPVGASGLGQQGEYIYRQLAQFTGGNFVFLTYAQPGAPSSGPGVETTHDVANYSVDTLDRLVVRLVREELAKLPRAGGTAQLQAQPTATAAPAPQGAPTTISLGGVTGMTKLGSGGFSGRWDIDGLPLEIGSEAALTQVKGWNWPEKLTIPINRQQVSQAGLLLSLGNGYAGFRGKTVGRLIFDTDAGTVEVPLVAGHNIRDWCISKGQYQVVTELEDPNAREVWRGALTGCDEAALSALLVNLPTSTVRSMTIVDESQGLLSDQDPGIYIYALSVR